MNLTPMQFKNYVWPHNPKIYSIKYRRAVVSDKVPFAHYRMQNLGLDYRVMSGEGEFVGNGAYDEFKKLATVFYLDGPGMLVHPVWQPATAYFVSLELVQEPEENYICYRFEFWEDTQKHKGAPSSSGDASAIAATQTVKTVAAAAGDTVWSIAAKCGTTVEAIMSKNPGLRNPGALEAGQKVVIS